MYMSSAVMQIKKTILHPHKRPKTCTPNNNNKEIALYDFNSYSQYTKTTYKYKYT